MLKLLFSELMQLLKNFVQKKETEQELISCMELSNKRVLLHITCSFKSNMDVIR